MADIIGEWELSSFCQEGIDVYFIIASSEINIEGVARKNLNSNKCLHNVEILNGVAKEVVLQFESGISKISGKWELENAGKLTIESKGGLEIGDLKLENVRELKIQDSGGNQKALIKGVSAYGKNIDNTDYSLKVDWGNLYLGSSVFGRSIELSGQNLSFREDTHIESWGDISIVASESEGFKGSILSINGKLDIKVDKDLKIGARLGALNGVSLTSDSSLDIFKQSSITSDTDKFYIKAVKTINISGKILSKSGGEISSGENYVYLRDGCIISGKEGEIAISSYLGLDSRCEILQEGLLRFKLESGGFSNHKAIKAENLNLKLSTNFRQYGVIYVTDKLEVILQEEFIDLIGKVSLETGSITDVGSLKLESEAGNTIHQLICEGCELTLRDPNIWSSIKVNYLNIKVDSYNKYDEKHECGHRVYNNEFCRSILSQIPRGFDSYEIIQETYSYGRVGKLDVSGNLELYAKNINVYVGNLVVHKKIKFLTKPSISVFTESYKMYPNFDLWKLIRQDDGGRRELSVEDIYGPLINARSEEEANLVAKAMYEFYGERIGESPIGPKKEKMQGKVTVTLNSIFHAGEIEGNINSASIGVISRGSYIPKLLEDGNNLKSAEEASKALVLVTDKVRGLSEELAIEKSCYVALNFGYEEMKQFFIKRGSINDYTLDIGYFRGDHLNLNIYGAHSVGALPAGSGTGLILHPMNYFSASPIIYEKLSDTIGLEDYLKAVGKTGILPIIGDGFYIKNELIPNALYQLGVILDIAATEAAEILLKNALEAYRNDETIVVGKPLNGLQKGALDKPILHLIWQDSCDGSLGCYSFELAFDEVTLSNFLEGAVLSLGKKKIELKVEGDVFIGTVGGIYKQGEELVLDLQGNFLNAGSLKNEEGVSINSQNIVNTGEIYIGKGGVEFNSKEILLNKGIIEIAENGKVGFKSDDKVVNAGSILIKGDGEIDVEGKKIYEPVYIGYDSYGNQVVERAHYVISGDGTLKYKGAYRSLAAVRDVKNIEYHIENGGATWETLHLKRISKKESGYKYYLIERVIDKFVDVHHAENIEIKVEKGECLGNGNVFIVKNSLEIECDVFDMKTITDYAINEYYKAKKRIGGRSSVSAQWTSSTTSRASIIFEKEEGTTPELIIRANECLFEGIGFPDIKIGKFILDCKKYKFTEHKISNWMKKMVKKNGVLSPNIPIIDLAKSDQPEKHLANNVAIVSGIRGVTKMEGPLDLWPLMQLASDIPAFIKDIETYQNKYGMDKGGAIIVALLSKYVSATLHIGSYKREEYVENTEVLMNEGNFGEADIHLGQSTQDEGSKVKLLAKKMRVRVEGDFKLEAGTRSSYSSVEQESGSFDIGVSLSGVKLGFSASEYEGESGKIERIKAEIGGDDLELIVDGKLEIEGAEIGGKEVKVEALEVLVKDVLDKVHADSSGSSIGMGINIGWSGGVMPYGSFSYVDDVKKSGIVKFISGITGSKVEVVTKKLLYNVAQITGSEELKIVADKIEYTEKEAGYKNDRGRKVSMSADVSPKGEMRLGGGVYYRKDGDVISGYMSSELFNMVRDLFKEDVIKDNTNAIEPQEGDTNLQDKKLEGRKTKNTKKDANYRETETFVIPKEEMCFADSEKELNRLFFEKGDVLAYKIYEDNNGGISIKEIFNDKPVKNENHFLSDFYSKFTKHINKVYINEDSLSTIGGLASEKTLGALPKEVSLMAKTPFKGVFITHDYAKHLEKVKGLYGEKGIHTHATAAGQTLLESSVSGAAIHTGAHIGGRFLGIPGALAGGFAGFIISSEAIYSYEHDEINKKTTYARVCDFFMGKTPRMIKPSKSSSIVDYNYDNWKDYIRFRGGFSYTESFPIYNKNNDDEK